MATQWFTLSAKSESDYRINQTTIIITDTGFAKLGEAISGAETVKLGWDPDRKAIALAGADRGDKAAFKLTRRGRSTMRQVRAEKLFQKFGIEAPQDGTEGAIVIEGDVAYFPVTGNAPARRGRRKKTQE